MRSARGSRIASAADGRQTEWQSHARTRRKLTVILLAAALTPGVIALVADMATMVRSVALIQGLIGISVLVAVPRKRNADKRIVIPLALVLSVGTFVGAVYVAEGSNSLSKWAIYSGLGFTWVVAVIAGERVGRAAHPLTLVRVVLLLCALDAVMLIPRFLIVGMEGRTSWGFSPWAAASAVSLATPGLSRRERLFGGAVVVAVLLGTALSGMRSAVFLAAASFGAAAIYLARSWHKKWVRRIAIVMVVGAVSVSAAIENLGLSETAERQASLVAARMNATLLREDGIVLDEDAGGREFEAREAMAEFERRGAWHAWAIGYGHGFTFFNSVLGEVVAHVHISPLAFFVRYGVLGVALYGGILLLVCWNAIRELLARRGTAGSALRFMIHVTVVTIVGGGIIAGSMMIPISWFAVGFGAAIAKSSSTSPA